MHGALLSVGYATATWGGNSPPHTANSIPRSSGAFPDTTFKLPW